MTGRRRPGGIAPKLASLLEMLPLPALMTASEALTVEGHGRIVTYSPSLSIRLASVEHRVCQCCPSNSRRDEVLAAARHAQEIGCRELFLAPAPGQPANLSHLAEMAQAVLDETKLLPHIEPGLLTAADYARLRPHAASMRIAVRRLCQQDVPDTGPARRLAAIRAAGRAGVPLTVGLSIGIGESRADRIEALAAIRDIQRRHGHLQSVDIRQGDRGASPEEHLWTIAAARLILGSRMTIQTTPNSDAPADWRSLLRAGVNDWGGISADPEQYGPPWTRRNRLERETRAAGRQLVERLAIGPAHALDSDHWVDPALAPRIRRAINGRGLPRRARAHLASVP